MMIGMNVSVYNVDNGHHINCTMYVNSVIYCEVIHCLAVFYTLVAMFTTTARGERGIVLSLFYELRISSQDEFCREIARSSFTEGEMKK